MAFVKDKFDLGILKQDASTIVGLHIARDKNGQPIYYEYDDEYLATQQTESPGYGSLPPEKEFAIVRADWRAGFGLYTYDEDDPLRYFESYNIDLRNRGMAIGSYKPTTVTLPTVTAYTFSNGSLDTWAAGVPTGWTKLETNGTVAQESTTVHTAGGSSAKCTTNTGAAVNYGYIIYTVAWTNEYRSKRFRVKAWIKSDWYNGVSDGAYIQIYDGVGTTNSSLHTGGGEWEQLTATRQLDASATQLVIRIGGFKPTGGAAGGVCYVDDVTMQGYAKGAITDFAEFNNELYIAYGDIIAKLDADGDEFTYIDNTGAAITDFEEFSDDNLYIACGVSDAYWYMNTSETLTESTATDNTYNYLAFVHTTADTMYGSDSDNTIRSTTNPANGGVAWSDQTTVGSSYYAIKQLFSHTNALYIRKEDRVYYLDSSGNVQRLTEITRPLSSSIASQDIIEWQERLYMPWGDQALLEEDGGEYSWLNPSSYCTESSSFDGQVQAVAADEEWLFAAGDNSTKLEIFCGRYEALDTVRWVWHNYAEITLTGCRKLFVSSIYQRRLWVTSTSSSDSLYYIPLPTGYGNIASDTNRSFATDSSQYFITPWHHANFKGDNKAWIKLTLTMANTTDNIYWSAHYQKLGDSSWTSIGAFKTSPTTTQYIPVDASDSAPVSTMMRFKFTMTTNSATTTPILYTYDVRGMLYPPRRSLIYTEVRCADNIVLHDGTVDRASSAATISAALVEAKNTATWPVTIYRSDTYGGDTIYCRFQPTKPFMKVVMDETSKKFEKRYYLLLQKISLTVEATSASVTSYPAVRTATLVIAASDASTRSKLQADYVCDGATDEVEINAAITAGLDVQLSEGTFYPDSDILVNRTFANLHGSGWGTKIIAGSSWAGTNLITVSAGHTRISSMFIDGDSTIANGIVTSVDPVLISYILGQNFTTAAMNLDNNVTVENSIIRLCPTGILISGDDTQIYHTEVGWATGIEYGIDCQGSTLRIVGCHIWQPTIACVRIKYGDVEIADSILAESDKDGILIDTDLSGADVKRVRIHDNWIRQQNESEGDYDCIKVSGSFYLKQSSINNNNFAYTSSKQKYSIRGTIDDSVITGNNFKDGYATSPISITGYNTIKYNVGLNLRDEMELNPLVKNISGGDLHEGDVVVSWNPADSNYYQVTTTVTAGDNTVAGVLAETIVNNGIGRMVTLGKITTLKVNGIADIAINDYLATYTEAGISYKAVAGDMAFAIALEAYTTDDSNGVIDAMLITPRLID